MADSGQQRKFHNGSVRSSVSSGSLRFQRVDEGSQAVAI